MIFWGLSKNFQGNCFWKHLWLSATEINKGLQSNGFLIIIIIIIIIVIAIIITIIIINNIIAIKSE